MGLVIDTKFVTAFLLPAYFLLSPVGGRVGIARSSVDINGSKQLIRNTLMRCHKARYYHGRTWKNLRSKKAFDRVQTTVLLM